MFTIGEIFLFSIGVLFVGISISLCLAFLHLLIRFIDRRFGTIVEEKDVISDIPMQTSPKKRSKPEIKDDIPISGPMKIETSFEDKRIGKIETK